MRRVKALCEVFRNEAFHPHRTSHPYVILPSAIIFSFAHTFQPKHPSLTFLQMIFFANFKVVIFCLAYLQNAVQCSMPSKGMDAPTHLLSLTQVSPSMRAGELAETTLNMRSIAFDADDFWTTFEVIENGELGRV